ncbi:hypothetical protein [Pseudoruegeria sp. HB172150]|uniref:hypothetical protein n=1 Tax=Pseudoruegeria sp. HB172150 TaxID=2721164 RepID=UPI0015575A9D|nr:hypothetical protein [Pseudoruegeria sp. HB172150]
MTGKIVSAKEAEKAYKQAISARLEEKANPASGVLPPVSNVLIDTLFHAESDHRQEHHSLRRAA